jgi:hypothetical protein
MFHNKQIADMDLDVFLLQQLKFFKFSLHTIPMHCTNNLRVRNAHRSGSVLAIALH